MANPTMMQAPEQDAAEMQEQESFQLPEEYETFVAALLEYIFGEAEQRIKDQLRKSENLYTDIGSLTYLLVNEGAEQGKQAGVEMDMEMLLAVASEVIDSLLGIAAAMDLIPEDADPDDAREECMGATINAYLTQGNPSPDEQEAAMSVLEQMQGAGMVDEAATYVAERGAQKGIDPFAGAEA